MTKRWTSKEDDFLIAYFDAVGPYIGPHDLGRSEKATKDRVKKLKDSGAWEVYKTAKYHRNRALLLAGHINPEFNDDEHPLPNLKANN